MLPRHILEINLDWIKKYQKYVYHLKLFAGITITEQLFGYIHGLLKVVIIIIYYIL